MIILVLLIAQFVTLLGSQMAAFAVASTLYMASASASLYAGTLLFSALPLFLLSPYAGRFVDRFGHVPALVLSQSIGAGSALLSVGICIWLPESPQLLLLPSVLGSAAAAFDFPAMSVLTSRVFSQGQLVRMNGVLQIAVAISQVIAPLTAGLLLSHGSLTWIFAADAASFLLAAALIGVFRPGAAAAQSAAAGGSVAAQGSFAVTWARIRGTPLLLGLLTLAVITNINLGVVQVGAGALVLSQHGPSVLGVVLTSGTVGMLMGGAALSAWGGPRKPWFSLCGLAIAQGLLVVIFALHPSVVTMAIGAGVIFGTVAMWNGISQATWQTLIPIVEQGRVFALRSAIARVSVLLANMGAGVAIDWLAAPSAGGNPDPAYGATLVLGAVGAGTMLLAMLLTARGFAPRTQAQLALSVRE